MTPGTLPVVVRLLHQHSFRSTSQCLRFYEKLTSSDGLSSRQATPILLRKVWNSETNRTQILSSLPLFVSHLYLWIQESLGCGSDCGAAAPCAVP
jgi:hypothetical protein